MGLTCKIGGDVARYRTDFHVIAYLGSGNFSNLFKVLHRVDGSLYAMKIIKKSLHLESERMSVLKEAQVYTALGFHKNIVGYHTSWFEGDGFYIQLELCERSMRITNGTPIGVDDAAKMLRQIAKALHVMHDHGIAHLDVKPDNVFLKKNTYKLGDFSLATPMDGSHPEEKGDSRYMAIELLTQEKVDLSKCDMFSLAASVCELLKGSVLSFWESSKLREGKLIELPDCPLQLQTLLEAMLSPEPEKRPSAEQIVKEVAGLIF